MINISPSNVCQKIPLLVKYFQNCQTYFVCDEFEWDKKFGYLPIRIPKFISVSDASKPEEVLHELSKYENVPVSENKEVRPEATHSSRPPPEHGHWLLRFPAQCVLTAEAVLWERDLYRALKKQDKALVQKVR